MVLSITTVVTLSVEEDDAAAPVPPAPSRGKMPSAQLKRSVVCLLFLVESCCGKGKDGDLAGVVGGPVRLLIIWRLTCRGK